MTGSYFESDVRYVGDRMLDAEGNAVMMSWERPIMDAAAEAVCARGGDVLNVGFGMGYIDRAIQRHHPTSHTIVEAHRDVLRRMAAEGWLERAGVRVIARRWQDVASEPGAFDGIYFDTWNEDMEPFHHLVPQLLRAGGTYSFFKTEPGPGIGDDLYAFFEEAGFGVSFRKVSVRPPPSREQRPDGRPYWSPTRPTYHLPLVRKAVDAK